jgi:membrane carboxypeptidase/penicillin-binding protein PbpC
LACGSVSSYSVGSFYCRQTLAAASKEVNPARVVVAEDGTPLWRFADAEGIWRYPVAIEDVSPRYLQALIEYEDRWFWKHPGVNPLSVARAAWQDLLAGRVISGGSTLTMQVARLLDPHPRTFGGKVRQLWRALQLEWHLSKRDILTLYLNRAPFGGTLQGVGAASWVYLGKSPRSSAMQRRHCWPSYHRHRVACALTAGRSVRRRRGIKYWIAWSRRACGAKNR